MESIDILSGQYVTIKYEPASVVQRMWALVLDYIFMGLYALALFFVYNILADISDITTAFVVAAILSFPALCYHVLFETLMAGKTPGKVILRIRVTNVDGSTPEFLSYFLRWILLPIDMFPYGGIGALCIVFAKNHQRLGDLAAGTTVVKTFIKSSLNDLNDEFYEYKDNYQPTFKGVDVLTDGQIRLIADLLQNSMRDRAVTDALGELAAKIKRKLNVESQLSDRHFLELIVRDYNYYIL